MSNAYRYQVVSSALHIESYDTNSRRRTSQQITYATSLGKHNCSAFAATFPSKPPPRTLTTTTIATPTQPSSSLHAQYTQPHPRPYPSRERLTHKSSRPKPSNATMAWPAPNPGGVNFDSMANAEQIINHYNPNAPPNADAIEAEHQLIAQYNASSDELGRPLVPSDSDIQPGAGFSSSAAQRLLQGQAPPAGGSSGGGGGSGSNSGTNKPTIETRKSLQARGKNFHSSSTAKTQGRAWEERQRRDEAVSILESEEMVMWIAGVRNEVCFLSLVSHPIPSHSILNYPSVSRPVCVDVVKERERKDANDACSGNRVYHKHARIIATSSSVSNSLLRFGRTSGRSRVVHLQRARVV
jgi:hypothetical protein